MYTLYTLALLVAVLVSSPWWLAAMLVSGKYREGFSERLGRVPQRIRQRVAPHSTTSTIWIHAVSVGELLAAVPLIQLLQQDLAVTRPDCKVVISTTTRTGQTLAREKFGADSVFYFPFDFRWCIEPWLKVLRPDLVVLLETEFWPNFLHRVQRAGIPLAVVNARISDRSFPRYRALSFLWRILLRPVTVALAQSELDAERLLQIGINAGRIHMTGNLKYDTQLIEEPQSDVVTFLRQNLPDGPPVWVCGSTAEGEEAALLEAHRETQRYEPGLILILAPRHPERFAAVAAMLPPTAVRRSEWMLNPTPIEPGSIFLLDSIGELASVYALGYLAFVGGSLFPPGGGQNPLEPASFAVPILAGPYMQNFRGVTQALLDAGALLTVTPQSLAKDVTYLLEHPGQAFERGERASAQVEANRGATERTLHQLIRLLPGRDLYVPRAPEPPKPKQQPTLGRPVRVK